MKDKERRLGYLQAVKVLLQDYIALTERHIHALKKGEQVQFENYRSTATRILEKIKDLEICVQPAESSSHDDSQQWILLRNEVQQLKVRGQEVTAVALSALQERSKDIEAQLHRMSSVLQHHGAQFSDRHRAQALDIFT